MICLTIAGSDPSGGAGIQADLKTFEALGVYGASVLTLVTAQNTLGVQAVEMLPVAFIETQLRSVFDDLRVDAVKIGALGSHEVIQCVAERLRTQAVPIVILDPVMVSKHGAPLLDSNAAKALAERLIPLATLITPNRREAAELLHMDDRSLNDENTEDAARQLYERFRVPTLITGGGGSNDEVVDWYYDGETSRAFRHPRIAQRNQHGAGCTLASAICAKMAQGASLPDAIEAARAFVYEAMRFGPSIGQGEGPLMHRKGNTPNDD